MGESGSESVEQIKAERDAALARETTLKQHVDFLRNRAEEFKVRETAMRAALEHIVKISDQVMACQIGDCMDCVEVTHTALDKCRSALAAPSVVDSAGKGDPA